MEWELVNGRVIDIQRTTLVSTTLAFPSWWRVHDYIIGFRGGEQDWIERSEYYMCREKLLVSMFLFEERMTTSLAQNRNKCWFTTMY